MKEFLAVVSLLVGAVVAEPPAPYPASGWRPSGPAFELPQRGDQPSYTPVDPRNAARPNVEYGTPEEDVSVQGLPTTQEENPYFQVSPISGKQNVGPGFNSDIQNLNKGFQQSQYQLQQQRYREYERQRQLEAQANRQSRPEAPSRFVPRTTSTTEAPTTEFITTTELTKDIKVPTEKTKVEVTKQNFQEYPGELFLSSLAQLQLQPQFVPLQFGQLKAPLPAQISQVKAPEQAGYDATIHFAAFPSVLAQQRQQLEPALLIADPQAQVQPALPSVYQAPVKVQQPEVAVQPQTFYNQPNELYQPTQLPVTQYGQPVLPQAQLEPVQPQLAQLPPPAQTQPQTLQLRPQFQLQTIQPPQQYQPQPALPQQAQFQAEPIQYQPQLAQSQLEPAQFRPQPTPFQPQRAQFQPQLAQFQPEPPQFQPQLAQFQPQLAQFQPQPAQFQPQPAQFQPQPAQFQPKQFQPQPEQDAENINSYQQNYQPQVVPQNFNRFQQQPGLIQAQLVTYPQDFQQQFQQQHQQSGADALQSGFDVNQQGNDLDNDKNQNGDEETAVTAVATAFGTRTQPRTFTQYGAPYPVPKVQAAPSTTEPSVEDVTDDGPVVAQAVAIADGTKKKSAKLRRNRIRPIFTLDRTGHLVLAQQ